MTNRISGSLIAAALLHAGWLPAQDLEPRQYSNVPVGLNFFVAGVLGQEGTVLFDPAIQLENAQVSIAGPAVGYARSLAFGGMSGKVDVAAAHACLQGSADFRGQRYRRDVCGWTDAKIRVSVNFIGAPALTLQEFAPNRQNLVVGASLQVTAPVGDYDPARLANIGANRWAAKAELGVSQAFELWTFEAAVAATFHEDNHNFFGGGTRMQDPIYSVQLHLVRTFMSGHWIAIDSTHYRGGRSTLDGSLNADFQSNERLGLTGSIPVNRQQSVKLHASRGISERTGTDFDVLGIAWQYRWGAGL